jgi:hypothetical protein
MWLLLGEEDAVLLGVLDARRLALAPVVVCLVVGFVVEKICSAIVSVVRWSGLTRLVVTESTSRSPRVPSLAEKLTRN